MILTCPLCTYGLTIFKQTTGTLFLLVHIKNSCIEQTKKPSVFQMQILLTFASSLFIPLQTLILLYGSGHTFAVSKPGAQLKSAQFLYSSNIVTNCPIYMKVFH